MGRRIEASFALERVVGGCASSLGSGDNSISLDSVNTSSVVVLVTPLTVFVYSWTGELY